MVSVYSLNEALSRFVHLLKQTRPENKLKINDFNFIISYRCISRPFLTEPAPFWFNVGSWVSLYVRIHIAIFGAHNTKHVLAIF